MKENNQTKLKALIEYINSFDEGQVIKRNWLKQYEKSQFKDKSNFQCMENYRLELTRAGYLEIESRGNYKILKKIPTLMSTYLLRKIAYPKN